MPPRASSPRISCWPSRAGSGGAAEDGGVAGAVASRSPVMTVVVLPAAAPGAETDAVGAVASVGAGEGDAGGGDAGEGDPGFWSGGGTSSIQPNARPAPPPACASLVLIWRAQRR